MNLRTWVRALIAVSFAVLGLAETLSATGLVVELSPDGRWGSGVHTLAVSGPLQMLGAALLASGRKTRWALSILGCYIFLVGVFGNLPLILNPDVGWNAIAGLLINVAVLGGILYWFHNERIPSARRARPALPMTSPASAPPVERLVHRDSPQAHRYLRQVR
jgi:Na+-transporting NADH:ubiquinone oxidoreductase subunit NqrB